MIKSCAIFVLFISFSSFAETTKSDAIPAGKKLAKDWAAKLKGDASESFEVTADGKPMQLKIDAKTIQAAKQASEWSSRYGSKTPTQVREDFVKIAESLEEAKGELDETVKEREAMEKEIVFAKKEGADAKELQGLDGDLKKAQKTEAKASAKHDQLVEKMKKLTGEKGTIYLVPGKKIEDAIESFPGAEFSIEKSTLTFKSSRGIHRYVVQVCAEGAGCPAGTITSVTPECGPDLWRSVVNFTKLSNQKQMKVPTEEHLYGGVPCPKK